MKLLTSARKEDEMKRKYYAYHVDNGSESGPYIVYTRSARKAACEIGTFFGGSRVLVYSDRECKKLVDKAVFDVERHDYIKVYFI